MGRPCFKLEIGYPEPLAGVDEAGCAPLAGPVVAAAVILDRNCFPRGIDNSKDLPIEKREVDPCAAGQMRGDRGRRRIGRGDRHAQHLLGADAGDDPRGRGPGHRAGLGAGRRQCLPALAAAVEGDRRRRRQMPVDRRRLDRRQGHPRPDDGRAGARLSGLRLGDKSRLSRRPSITAASRRSG